MISPSCHFSRRAQHRLLPVILSAAVLALVFQGVSPASAQEHVVVREPPAGRGFMAPNNGGIWRWGDEILVMYVNGPHRDGTLGDGHSVHEQLPGTTYDTSRSFDGGLTWSEHATAFPRRTKSTGWPGPAPRRLEQPLDFAAPGTIVHFQRDDEGLTYLYTSTDRGRTWNGPFDNIPRFRDGVSARTNYEVTGPRSLTAYMQVADKNDDGQTRHRSHAVYTADGGLTWKLGPEISALSPWGEGLETEWDVHPSVARIDGDTLIASFRSGGQNQRRDRTAWFDTTRSTDGGRTWHHLARLGESPGNNGCPSSTVVVPLSDGGRRVVTLMWLRPPDAYSSGNSKLFARYSDDRGETWSEPITLRDDIHAWDTGYPIATARSDGKVVVAYWMKTRNQDEPNYIAATIWDAASGRAAPTANAAGRLVAHWSEPSRRDPTAAPDQLNLVLGNTVADDGTLVPRKAPKGQEETWVSRPPVWTTQGWVGQSALKFQQDGLVAISLAPETAAASLERMRETFTVAAWVRLDDANADGWTQIANVRSSWFLERGGDTGIGGTKYPSFWVNLDGHEGERGYRNVRGRTSLNDGRWHHVAATYDSPGKLQSIYVDGELENTATVTGRLKQVPSETINIGGRFNGASGWDGLIDDVRVYDYALTPEQIQQIALGGRNVVPKINQVGFAGGTDLVARAGVPKVLSADVSDLNGDHVVYAWSAEPADGVTFVPTATYPEPRVTFAGEGEYEITLHVNDGRPSSAVDAPFVPVKARFDAIVGLARTEPIDLSGQATRSRYGAGNRGWFGLRNGLWLKPGTYRVRGVDFMIPAEPDTRAQAGKSIIPIACGVRELTLKQHQSDAVLAFPAESAPVPVGRTASALFFLHTAAFADEEPVGTIAWEYHVRYADGSMETIPVRLGIDVANSTLDLNAVPSVPGVALGTTEEWLYRQRWDNPHPDRLIESVTVRSCSTKAAGILVAMSSGHR